MKSTFENIQAFITFKHLRCIHWNKWPLSERAGRLEGGSRGDREGGRAAKILNMKRKRSSDYNYYCQFMWTGIKYQSTQFYSCLGKRSSERPPEKSSCSVAELVSCSHLLPSFTVGSVWKTNENRTEKIVQWCWRKHMLSSKYFYNIDLSRYRCGSAGQGRSMSPNWERCAVSTLLPTKMRISLFLCTHLS